jgi:dipeptide/tripeptide permease
MVNGLCYLNYIEFSFILTLFSLLFRKFLINKFKTFILNLKNKKIQKVGSINDENVSLNKVFTNVDKYLDFIILFIFICLFWIKFINIYFSNNLAEDIDSFVNVYNHIKKK